MNSKVKLAAICVCVLPACAFACSGSDVQGHMQRNQMFGTVQMAIVAVLLVASASLSLTHRLGWRATAVIGAMFALHPRWWIGVAHGDCGSTLSQAAPIATFLAAAVLTLQLLAMWCSYRSLQEPAAAG